MISQKILFKCPKCNYMIYKIIGDVRPSLEELKPCPICKSQLNSSTDKLNAFEEIVMQVKNLLH